MRTVLFFLRLGLYLLVVSLPFLHPAIAVPYDRVGLLFYFVIVPWQMLVAYFLAPPRLRPRAWLLCAALPALLFVLLASGLEAVSLGYLAGSAAAFLLTALVFADRPASVAAGLARTAVAFEPFLPAWLAWRLVSYSRASEAVARESSGVTQLLLLVIPLAFLLHALVLYLAAFRGRRDGRTMALYLGLALPLFLLLALVLPADFVRHRVVLNRLDKDLVPRPIPLDERGPAWEGGNLLPERNRWPQGENPREGEEDSEEGRPGRSGSNQLEGIPADQWNELGKMQAEENRQYAVMVVASAVQPVYAADAYFGQLDPERGFLRSSLEEEPLNELAYLRFLETWRDPSPPPDRMRRAVEVSYLSTLPERYVAYRPDAIQPTVLRRQYSPFQFSFQAVSRISLAGPRDWSFIRELSPGDRAAMAGYLDVPLSAEVRGQFAGQLEQALRAYGLPEAQQPADAVPYAARIEAVLRGFSTYQYELGFTDDTSVASMRRFLLETRRGDCTEFSNTAAILLRLAGVPARVVTGYLASRDLQSFAHLRGLLMLRQAIPELQEFPIGQLLLVTTAQRHSWVQAYLPAFGWIDLESTAYAIPPPPGQNPGDMNVVIPLIQGEIPEPPPLVFPWRAALRLAGALAVLTVLGLYVYRYLAQGILALRSGRSDPRGLAALHTLLLLRLAARGYPLKVPSQTIQEYAEAHPELRDFARRYTELRYRESLWQPQGAAALRQAWAALRGSYAEALQRARSAAPPAGKGSPGPLTRLWLALRRAFSLRGLYYL